MQQPERDARELLERVWQDQPVPVDPIYLARELGIDVYVADLTPGWSGALMKRAYEPAGIYLNRDEHPNRQRFTAAHELGHYYKRQPEDHEAYEYVDRRDQRARAGTDPEEIYANAFAAALLMPREEVEQLHAQGLAAPTMAHHFGVSAEAMSIRLDNLGLR
jgi:Zn-dependent peptidase ImmA (M78 family)